MWNTNRLDDLLPQLWQTLESACAQAHHPWRTPVLATAGRAGCAVRTVVLRQACAADRLLVCHCDRRSDKVRQLLEQPQVEWLFYDPTDKVQLRARGLATVHCDDALAAAAWRETPLANRINYGTALPPGSPVEDAAAAWPAAWRAGDMTWEQSEAGRANFALLATTVDRLELLQLAQPLHRRAAFTWAGEHFVGTWLVP